MESHLLQMRGLKQKRCATSTGTQKSHLLQMRGLKQKSDVELVKGKEVASFTDAWIETVPTTILLLWTISRIFYRCVD